MFKCFIICILFCLNSYAEFEIPQSRKPTEKELTYGREVAAEISKEFPLDSSFENAERIRKVLKPIIESANGDINDWRVIVFKSPRTKNISGIRGNTLFVWSGMLKWLQNDNDLAAPIAHEVAHILLSHDKALPQSKIKINEILSSMITTGIQIGVSAAGAGGIATGFAANAAGTLSKNYLDEKRYGPEEIEADKLSKLLLKQSGFDETAYLEFWKKADRAPSMNNDSIPYFAAHPLTPERFNALKNEVKDEVKSTKDWIVKDDDAEVFLKPDNTSEVLARLNKSERVEIEETFGSWFFLSAPVKGYIKGADVEPDESNDFSH